MGSIQEMYLEMKSYLSYENKVGKLYWIQNTGRHYKIGLEAHNRYLTARKVCI